MLSLDFQANLAELVGEHMQQIGFPSPPSASPGDVLLHWHRLTNRLIEPKPRKLSIAEGLTSPQEHAKGLELIKQKIEAGAELRPHLSRGLLSNDGLFNDWGIHHLHLGTTAEGDGFVKRTGPLLYAKFDDDGAYLLAIRPHWQWTNTDFVECIHANWPELIAEFKMNAPPEHLTSAQRKNLRRKNANATVSVRDGTVYLPLGGGMMVNGDSLDARIRSEHLAFRLSQWEKQLRAQESPMRAYLATQGVSPPDPWKFDLWVRDGFVSAVSGQTGPEPFVLPLGQL